MESTVAPVPVPGLDSLEGLRRVDPMPAGPATPPAALAAQPAARPKLNFSGMAAPAKLGEARVEDLTIDGICGVY